MPTIATCQILFTALFCLFFFPKEEEFPFRTKAFGKEIPSSCATSRMESFLCMYFSWHNEHIQTIGMHTAALAGPYGSREEGVRSVAQVNVAWRGLWSSVLSINASILLCYTNVLEDVTTGGNEQREKILNLLGFILLITKGCIITSKAISYIGVLHLAHSTLMYKYLLKW